MNNTIIWWPSQPFQSQFLNAIWNLFPGFIYWSAWKERNYRTFKDTSTPVEILWSNLKYNLQETLALVHWQDSDMPSSPAECLILKRWNLDLKHPRGNIQNSSKHFESPISWSPPMTQAFKMNFDGAAKGNPGLAGYGGIFRNHEGIISYIFFDSLSRDSNNATKIEGLWHGLSIADKENFFPLEVEWDSQILIKAAIRLHSGSTATKVASSWRLLSRLEQIEKWLKVPRAITFKHIRRTSIKVVDRLANQGATQIIPFYEGPLHNSDDAQLIQHCTSLVHHDLQALDAGDQRE